MCWNSSRYITSKEYTKEDVPCFKLVKKLKDGSYVSFYQGAHYTDGNDYTLSKGCNVLTTKTTYFYDTEINQAFHSYATCVQLAKHFNPFTKNSRIDIYDCCDGERLRRLDWLPGHDVRGGYELVKLICIVPAGSEYYVNERGEIASDKIKIVCSEEIPYTKFSQFLYKVYKWFHKKRMNRV